MTLEDLGFCGEGEGGARQVADCAVALCRGTRGMLGLRHSGVTLVLGG